MATKPEAAKPEADEPVKKPAKGKKKLIIILAVVLLLALVGGVAFYFISKQRAAALEGADGAPAAAAHAVPKGPPVYLPLDNMVVNLADPGGEKVAQVGITLQVLDAKAGDSVKVYLPTIRSSILMLISQRTADELLSQEGKQKLAKDILRETSIPFGGAADVASNAPKKKAVKAADQAEMPVVGVLFSSFIVQ
ncbi:MAG: flagellar basal body-associated FliL family protein [Gammaproteobacteria bacterium]|uniref:flagellar basal body-associated FliL family protein n=1 Tax=Rhodoferax sp. TaxID=50421 RepID=UPI0017C35247|nr:flagellar basal body-associated FliL family protein [Rhodoferax sp.]MBU3900456.1 flagellar basal body-associated FliL family protein [Gammaproteobacteria bacterium]MBA3059922.1 flagellar basal body protein FliL [Rhodoferax sp.]MBU3997140.1 flagellar basal body-associated FliL family protein [Gammaproteobacteria bacterium]MBU4079901.1 flagellar basal body-associated FliL family protein [Gammaproteobacteria bacterium]MBU4112916.1 flagellar basal body-associated FliL family protein [Gammaprote